MAEVLDANLIHVASLADGGPAGAEPEALLVRWSAPAELPGGRLFQVYVNGELAGATGEPEQRELAVPADGESAVLAAAVVAVGPAEAETDFAHLLTAQQRGGRALLRWPRLAAAGLGSAVDVFGNGGSGAIDYETPLNDRPVELFPGGSGKWGLGLGGFGGDDFGWGGGRAVGLGLGAFGVGEFGFEAEWESWLSGPLPAGAHRFAVVAYDRLGNAAAPSAEVELTVAAVPPVARELSAEGSAADDSIVLSWRAADR